ncbi:MAG: hypothetical protein WDN01_18625 [Rhizomicrobium sp.]
MDLIRAAIFGFAAVFASPPFVAAGMLIWERLKPYFIPQAEIDVLARDCIAHFGVGATEELRILAQRAGRRGETAEEATLVRVMAAVRRMERTRDGVLGSDASS